MTGNILPYKGIYPKIAKSAYIAPNAYIIGDVEIGEDCGIWFGCVVRGDVNHIRIGDRTNIQDGSIVHVTRVTSPTIIGSGVTVGHSVTLHGCTIKDNAFIGMGALVMDDVVVESYGWVGAGAMVTPNKIVPANQVWTGRPAKFFRETTPEERAYIPKSASNYCELVKEYMD